MEEGWERAAPRVELDLERLQLLIDPAFPGRRIQEHAVLETGLANTNIRFRLHGDEVTYVLRLNTRRAGAAVQERDLMHFLAGKPAPPIPVAPLIYSDPIPERGEHPYSIWLFVEGTLLQELFETLPDPELVDCARSCGRVLAGLAAHSFPRCGSFGPNLEIATEYGAPSQFVLRMTHLALFERPAGTRLGTPLRDELWRAVERWSPALAAIDGRYTLVHADYKRSNLLMRRSTSGWRVAAVLDWEFACAGPPLIDVGLFLRAGSALPDGFRDAFTDAYQEAGGWLPDDWLPLSRLVDLLSQLTFLDQPDERPKVFAECRAVIEEGLQILS